MRIVELVQGTQEWHVHRAQHFNASDAPAMLGCSPYKSRSQLVREIATGISADVDAATRERFDTGHRAESLARPLAEKIIGEDLYPCVGVADDAPYSASFDGLTLLEDVAFEHKSLNDQLRACMHSDVAGNELPKHYQAQMEQQLLVSGAERVLFMASKWNGDDLVEERHCWYVSDLKLRAEIIAGWQQFAADVAAYQPEVAQSAAVGQAPEQLPALSVVARGMVEHSNLQDFREKALAAIQMVNRNLQTDDDFATAELTIKAFKAGEDKLAAAKDQILGQMSDVDHVMRTIDEVSAELRRVRLDLGKQVDREKENRKSDIVQAGAKAVRAHYDQINESLGEHRIQPPQSLVLDLGAAIKGKKSLTSMKDAVDTAVAGCKIAANEQADRIRANVRVYEAEVGSWSALFPDRVALCATKAQEDLRNLMTARIAQAKADEQKRADDAKAREEAAQSTTGAEASEAAEPDATEPVRAPAAVVSVGRAGAAPTPAGAKIKLGDLNARIAPITVTADGLRALGFQPVAREKGATLYAEADFGLMCAALQDVLAAAAQKKAA